MIKKVFIDGSQGTTGLRIFDRLSSREDIELIKLPEELIVSDLARELHVTTAEVVKKLMGLGMLVFIDPANLSVVEEHLKSKGEVFYKVGEVVEGSRQVKFKD